MFLDTLARHSCDHADKVAIELIGGQSVTYRQLGQTVNRTANYLLSLGVAPGDRVAAQLPKCLPFIYLHLAAAKIGAIFLPLNPAYPLTELRYFLADSAARHYFSDLMKQADIESIQPDLPSLEAPIFLDPEADWEALVRGFSPTRDYALPTDPDQTAMMLYTSGTTSRPKGAQITHGNLTANIESLHSAWGWRVR